jgi:hypothetical protein
VVLTGRCWPCTSAGKRELSGASDVRRLAAELLSRKSSWECDNRRCTAIGTPTCNYCVICKLVLCRDCGGPTAKQPPLPVFRCVHCLLGETASHQAGGELRELRRHIIRGRLHVLSLTKRGSSRSNDVSGIKSYYDFCELMREPPLPVTVALITDFMIYGVSIKKWDSSTVTNKVGSVSSLYQKT